MTEADLDLTRLPAGLHIPEKSRHRREQAALQPRVSRLGLDRLAKEKDARDGRDARIKRSLTQSIHTDSHRRSHRRENEHHSQPHWDRRSRDHRRGRYDHYEGDDHGGYHSKRRHTNRYEERRRPQERPDRRRDHSPSFRDRGRGRRSQPYRQSGRPFPSSSATMKIKDEDEDQDSSKPMSQRDREEWDREWKSREEYLDRHWYMDEEGTAADPTMSDPFDLGFAGSGESMNGSGGMTGDFRSRAVQRREEMERRRVAEKYPRLVAFQRRMQERKQRDLKFMAEKKKRREQGAMMDTTHQSDEDPQSSSKDASLIGVTTGMSSMATQMQLDNERWQNYLLERSGAIDYRMDPNSSANADGGDGAGESAYPLPSRWLGVDEDESEQRVTVIAKEAVPPFLDGRQVFSNKAKAVGVVRDPTSDMAVIARKGSDSLLKWRESKDRLKMQGKWWEVSGSTRQGKLLGMADPNAKKSISSSVKKESDESEYDYKAASQFTLKHMSRQSKKKSDDESSSFVPSSLRSRLPRSVMERMRKTDDSDPARLAIKQTRQSLPIFQSRASLMRVIRDNQVIVLVGETGSGKTTQLAQYLFEEGFGSPSSMICCTQPRRVAAMSVAKRVAEEMDVTLGEEVGYAIRFEDCTQPGKTVIKYCTDGVLLREALTTTTLDRYSCVIMDEAHERSLNTDILFGVLKRILQSNERRDLRVIVTSATLDASKFSRFFGDCPIFKVKGRTFKVDVHYSKNTQSDYIDAAVKQVLKLHIDMPLTFEANDVKGSSQQKMTEMPADILVFMTGMEDINCVCSLIKQKMDEIIEDEGGLDEQTGKSKRSGLAPLIVLPMYSQLPADLQAMIFDPTQIGQRKCIVSTNIAETSLTVHGIRYVVDCGYCKLKVFKPNMSMDSLTIVPISRSNANQRSGRAGRTGPGVAFRLYTRLQYESEMLQNTVPEIERTNLGNVVLLLKNLGVSNLIDFPFMDPPSQESLIQSMFELWSLNALDSDGSLTDVGKSMVLFPLEPSLSRMLVNSMCLKCSDEIITIVSMLSVPTIFFRPINFAQESDKAREKFFVPESDHLTLLNVYQSWQRNEYSVLWCKKHYIHSKSLRKVREIREQLLEIMRVNQFEVLGLSERIDEMKERDSEKRVNVKQLAAMHNEVIRKCVCSAYLNNACKLKGFGEYINLRRGIPCHLHSSSSLYGSGFNPDYVIYHELVMTGKEWMRHVTAIHGQWLAELAPMFYSVRVSGASTDGPSSSLGITDHQITQSIREQKRRAEQARRNTLALRKEQAELAAQAEIRDSVLEVGGPQRRSVKKGRRDAGIFARKRKRRGI